MKLTIEHDDGKTEVFQDITDLYIATRQTKPMSGRGGLAFTWETTSHSWGGNLRELLKEVRQSVVELEDILREFTHGGSS